jgi:hypothetical protein
MGGRQGRTAGLHSLFAWSVLNITVAILIVILSVGEESSESPAVGH